MTRCKPGAHFWLGLLHLLDEIFRPIERVCFNCGRRQARVLR